MQMMPRRSVDINNYDPGGHPGMHKMRPSRTHFMRNSAKTSACLASFRINKVLVMGQNVDDDRESLGSDQGLYVRPDPDKTMSAGRIRQVA
jgi:hypothetical protein